jgi:hypothetical protein
MKLSDVMSAASGLSSYAELSLVIFVGVFLGVALDLVASKRRHDALGFLPLEGEVEPQPATLREGRR